MSHKATNWLADLPPGQLSASEFRVLFHLCDCHNPSSGCFPTQAYLKERADVSNGTVNNALNSLEQKGLIKRHVSFDTKTHRRKPTRYILGFEISETQEPSPEYGDGKTPGGTSTRLQQDGDGAISNPDPVPSPIHGASHLQPAGEQPVSKPVNNQARERAVRDFGETAVQMAEFWAPSAIGGRYLPPLTVQVVDAMLAMKLVSVDQCRALSLHFTDPETEQRGKTHERADQRNDTDGSDNRRDGGDEA